MIGLVEFEAEVRELSRKGLLFCIVAPSGAGKTTLVRALINQLPGLQVSVSTTTRPMRPDDIEGVDYHFVTKEAFNALIKKGEFLEFAEVFGHYYGTSEQSVSEALSEGVDVILEIDWQGARNIKQHFPDAVSIFILPPSLSVLKERLIGRAQDEPEVIERRFQQARSDLSHHEEQDFLVINEDIEDALCELRYIICASRLRTSIVRANSKDLLVELDQNG